MIMWMTRITIGSVIVFLVASCTAPLPRLEDYSSAGSRVGLDDHDQGTWKIAEDGDLDETIQLLLEDPDPDVQAHARNVRGMLEVLKEQRQSKLEEILSEESDELKRASRWAASGDEIDPIPEGLEPMALRKRLVEDALDAERLGEFGLATKLATIARSLEWIVDDRVMMEQTLESPMTISSRNIDRMKNVRLVDPMIALKMIDSEAAMRRANEVSSGKDEAVEPITSVRQRIMNTAKAIGYFEDLFVTETDRELIHEAGIEELVLVSRTLVEKGHPIPEAFLDFLENDLPGYKGENTLKLLIELDFAQMNLAGGSLPDSYSMRVFGDGAAGALDRQTSVIWPKEFEQYMKSSGRGYRGVGVQIEEDADGVVVLRPHNGGPAKRSGVRDGDVLLEVEGVPVAELGVRGLADVVDQKGRKRIEIMVRHPDETSESITIPLGPVTNLNVTGWRQIGLNEDGLPIWWWLADDVKRIGYLRLERFAADGARDVRRALQHAQAQAQTHGGRLEGLIIDLRSNPGGQVVVAEEMVNLFMGRGPVFRSIGRDGHMETDHADERHSELEGLPLVILVDENSASASELVAGLLKMNGKAIILGERTFGKGSVQCLVPASSSDCLVRVTIAWYQLPDEDHSLSGWRFVDRETSPQDWGVEPHIRISTSMDQTRDILNARKKWYSGRGLDVKPSEDETIEILDPATELALGLLGSKIKAVTPK
jgi:C-terminal peptidase prc